MQEFVDGVRDLEMQLLPSPPVDKHGGGSSARQAILRGILVLQSLNIFIAGKNHGSPPSSRTSSSKSIQSNLDLEQDVIDIGIDSMEVDAAQTAPLLKTVENTYSGKQIRKFTHILRSVQAFKAHSSSSLSHHGSSGANQGKPLVYQLQHSQIENISKIVQEKNLMTLQEFGGLREVAYALNTDLVTGITDHEALHRLQAFHSNHAPTVHKFFHLTWESLKTKTILLLSVAVFLSLVFGINQEGLKYGWHDGVVVLIAIILLVFFSSIGKYWQEQRARKNFDQKKKFPQGTMGNVHVKREGVDKCPYESELVYGDVVLLKKGCQVPADGLFVKGENLEVDYGSDPSIINEQNPFLLYGGRVINGNAHMVVTSVNINSTAWSEMIRKASGSGQERRPNLETHLDKLRTCMHYSGLIIGILIILVLTFRFMAGKIDGKNGYKPGSMTEPTETRSLADQLKKIIREDRAQIKFLSVLLVGVTEGVPFVVSLAIFYWNNKTLSGEATLQDSQGVAKISSVTRICTDMFGDFTVDEMEVERVFVGEDISGCATLPSNVIEALCDGIGISNEESFHHWAKDNLGFKSDSMRGIIQGEEKFLHFKGPLKEILSKCTHYFDGKGHKAPIDDEAKVFFGQLDEDMQHKQKLRTISFACKHAATQTQDANDFILVSLLGLKAKNNEATRRQVLACRERGIETVIVSRKKLSVLKDIALQCEVLTNGDSEPWVITGEVFRKYTDSQRLEKVDKIRVLGEASPFDKLLLVDTLRKKGEVVAFLGQRTDEAPALKGADIGIAMGTWSSMKARESCDIFMFHGSFSDLVSIVASGKCIYHNIQSYLQLVLITTTSSTLINFLETAAFGEASLTVIQLIWVNLLVSFLGGLALLTKPSTEQPVSLVPISCKRSLVTVQMARNIILQVLYQAMCSVIIHLIRSALMGTNQDTKTVVGNVFILCQFFNQFNARELQMKNFFRGIHQHKEFWVAIAMFTVLQANFFMVQDTLGFGTRLNWKVWAGCVLAGLVTWLVDLIGKCISWFIQILSGLSST